MLKKVLIGATGVVVVFLGVVAMQPADYTVTRSATMAARPAKVFALVNNIRRWNDWSPWAKMDPSQTITYEGPVAGIGAAQSWNGKKTGTGRMELVRSDPNRLIGFRMEFRTPMAGTADIEFAFAASGRGTAVTWTMRGKNNFVAKAFGLFMSMDKMMGGHFETGLAGIKAIVETSRR